MGRLARPVHLYVKTHRVTGLKYFGRTTADPHTYPGSGAYWRRHIQQYGNSVRTEIIGTYLDESELRSAATSYSARHKVADSTEWANLLPEDGGEGGAGYDRLHDHSDQVAALDAAVERGLRAVSGYRESPSQHHRPESSFNLPLVLIAFGLAATAFMYFLPNLSSPTSGPPAPTTPPDPANSTECYEARAEHARIQSEYFQATTEFDSQRLEIALNEADSEARRHCF